MTVATLNAADYEPKTVYGVLWWSITPLTTYDDRKEAEAIAEQTGGVLVSWQPGQLEWMPVAE